MGQLSTYKIDGQPRTPFKSGKKLELEALFGTENGVSLELDEVIFSDSTTSNNNTVLLQKQADNPLEGAGVSIEVADNINGTPYSYNFDFYTDWNTLIERASNELSVNLIKENSLPSFDKRALSITFALLEDKGFLTNSMYQNVPYIVENRKTLLEKIQILGQTWMIFKAGADEIHKILNIASDITSAGIVQAGINLTVTIANLILLISKLSDLLGQIQESFFPIPLYHRGVKPKVFIEAAASYLGYDSVEFGNHIPFGQTIGFGDIMNGETWLGSKNDEKGFPFNLPSGISGALKAGDYGYNLSQTLDVLEMKYTARRAIIDNVLHVRPESDPFWFQNAGPFTANVKIEQSILVNNGTKRKNRDEFNSNRVIKFRTDDSDPWTLEDLADTNDPLSSEKIISGVIVEPLSVINQKRVISNQGKLIEIPHAMCNRKDTVDDLLDLFVGTASEFDSIKQLIIDRIGEVSTILGQAAPQLATFINNAAAFLLSKSGCIKIQDHFFSVPKCVYLVDTNIGNGTAPRVPANYADIIGASALLNNWHNYYSFVPGIKNPNDFNDTNAKDVYEGVRVKFNIKNFSDVLDNPYFSDANIGSGKFTAVKWNVEGDFATVDFYVFNPWMQNVEQKQIYAD